MPAESTKDAKPSLNTKSPIDSIASDYLKCYENSVKATVAIVDFTQPGMRPRVAEWTSSKVHPLINKLPSQKTIRTDDPSWQAFKDCLPDYINRSTLYGPVKASSESYKKDFVDQVNNSDMSNTEKEAAKTTFASAVDDIHSRECPSLATTERLYKSIFDDRQLHPNLDENTAKALVLYRNRPTEEDYLDVCDNYARRNYGVDDMSIGGDEKDLLERQALVLVTHSCKYLHLNRVGCGDAT